MTLAAQLAANGIAPPPAAKPNPWALLFGHAAPHPLPAASKSSAREERSPRRAQSGVQQSILEALESGPGTTNELAVHCGVRTDAMRKSLERMTRKGTVTCTSVVVRGRTTNLWEAL
jgi:hypothetical protein